MITEPTHHHVIHGRHGTDRRQRIHQFLRANPVGVLSTVDPDGDPHGSVIYFTIDERFHIRFLTKTDTHKYDILHHHDRVMLTAFDCTSQTTAQIIGRARELHGSTTVNRVAGGIMQASLQLGHNLPPITKLEAGSFAAFAIDPVQIRMAAFAGASSGDYEQLFDSIESFELTADD